MQQFAFPFNLKLLEQILSDKTKSVVAQWMSIQKKLQQFVEIENKMPDFY